MFDNYIQQSRLQPLKDILYRNSNRVMISTFVKRWQPETNIFDMSFGEMTITLDDVPILVGISVLGWSVNTPWGLPMQRGCLLGIILNIGWYTSISAEISVFYSKWYDKWKILSDIILDRYGPIYPRWKYLIYRHVMHLRSFYKRAWETSTKSKYPLWVYDSKLTLNSFI